MGELLESVLVTGATGYIGRRLVERLLVEATTVTVAVRTAERCPAGWRDDPRLGIVETGPLETASNLAQALRGVDRVVHLAGLAHRRDLLSDADALKASNEVATQRVVDAVGTSSVRTLIHVSSLAAVSGNACGRVVDDGTASPSAGYGQSKRRSEDVVATLAAKGVLAVSLRPPVVVGPDAPGNWRLLRALAATRAPVPFASVNNRRSLISLDYLLDAVLWLLKGRWSADFSGAYCIADPEPLSLADMVTELRRGLGAGPLLFPFPVAVLKLGAACIGQRTLSASLFENLEVCSARFRDRFEFHKPSDIRAAIRASAAPVA